MKELKLECLVEGYKDTYFEIGQVWETRNRRKIVLKGFTGNATYPLLFDMGNNRYKEFTLKGNLFEDYEYRLDLVKLILPKISIKTTLLEQPKKLSEYLKENNAYESFIENCVERALLDPESFEQKRDQEENKDMGDFFIWADSKQGHDYWYNLFVEQPKNIVYDINKIVFAEVDKRISEPKTLSEYLKRNNAYESFIENCVEAFLEDIDVYYNMKSDGEIMGISNGFIWQNTKQDSNYWKDLYYNQPRDLEYDLNEIVFAEVDKRIPELKTLSSYLKKNNAYESFIENCIERALLNSFGFKHKRDNAEDIDITLLDWSNTKEGHNYWYDLYRNQPKNLICDLNEIIFAEVDKRINLNMEDKLKKTCIIQSGGLESCTMLLDAIVSGLVELGYEPTKESFNEMIQNKDLDYMKVVESIFPITFDYGQRNNKELEVVQKYCDKLLVKSKIIKMSHFSELCGNSTALLSSSNLEAKKALDNVDCSQVNTYVPFRNAQFIFAAACFAESNGCEQLYMGINAGDLYGYWDTSVEFVNHIKAILVMNRENKIKLITPFINDYKVDIVNKGIQLSTKTGILPADFAWSCYTRGSSHNKECGECSTCVEKIVGMSRSGYFSVEDIMNKFDNVNEEKLKQYLQVL